MSRVPGLVFRLGISFMRFKRRVRKNARILRKSMIRNGMERKLATDLAEAYAMNLSIRELMKHSGAEIPFNFNKHVKP